MTMKNFRYSILLLLIVVFSGCVTEFLPETNEDQQLLVVSGMVTDQTGTCTIKLSKSLPLGESKSSRPLSGCQVYISDDHNGVFPAYESSPGSYSTYSGFTGVVGRKYTLHITSNDGSGTHNYESIPAELKAVPPIDSLYYEKKPYDGYKPYDDASDGAFIYLDTHSEDNSCRYYRWEFEETWEFRLPYSVPNHTCWLSANSNQINIKSTASISSDKINRFQINSLSGSTDRLKYKYSMLVKQYSLNEEEFEYWEKLKNVAQQVGGLYDVTPSSIPSNVYCTDNPAEKVLGYFSVSATKSKRIFIKDRFMNIIDLYSDCIADTIWNNKPIPYLNEQVWVIIDVQGPPLTYKVTTYQKGCYDCTVRGSNQRPSYWDDAQ